MKRKTSLLRGALLAFFILTVIGGLISTDYYLRHKPTRKATRELVALGIPISAESAVVAARQGDFDVIELLESAKVKVGIPDASGVTPLIAAMRANQREMVDFLLIRTAVVENIDVAVADTGVTALSYALSDRDFSNADRFLRMGANPNVVDDKATPLLLSSVRTEDQDPFSFLMKSGADTNLKGNERLSPLAHAINTGNREMIRDLLKAGASTEVDGQSGDLLLVEAINAGSHEITGLLIKSGASVNKSSAKRPLSPLAIAIEQQDGYFIHDLLKAGADPNVTGELGDPLLVEAVNTGNHDLANELLINGAEVDFVGSSGQTALALSVHASDLTMINLLLEKGADPDFSGEGFPKPLAIASASQDVPVMRELINSGANANDNDTVISVFNNRDYPGLKLLLEAGADPEAYDKKGRRILDMAVTNGSTESVRILLAAGTDANGKLWSALRSGSSELVELVLTCGAQVNEFDRLGGHPLSFALENQRYDITELLLDRGANPNIMRTEKESWVATAIRTGDRRLADTLMDNGACTHGLTSEDGHSLLGWAIAREWNDIAMRLIDEGTDVRFREPSPASSSFRAQFSESQTFQYHLLKDSRINQMMMAAVKRDHKLAQALMDAGARGNDFSRKYLWPVSIAAWHSDTKMMQIAFGRDPDPDKQPRKVVIDLSSQKLTLYENDQVTFTGNVSTGRRGNRTPVGSYVITDKHKTHNSSIYGSSMPYFQRLSCAAFGFHQGSLPGYPASHGCIRMTWTGAKTMFYKTEVGDLVTIKY